jgi:hypothetical protein
LLTVSRKTSIYPVWRSPSCCRRVCDEPLDEAIVRGRIQGEAEAHFEHAPLHERHEARAFSGVRARCHDEIDQARDDVARVDADAVARRGQPIYLLDGPSADRKLATAFLSVAVSAAAMRLIMPIIVLCRSPEAKRLSWSTR